jgi:phosphotransferase system IIA component
MFLPMFNPFSLLQWHTSLDPHLKLRIKSPVDAYSHPRSDSSDPLMASGLQGDGLWLELKGKTLYSPFHGIFSRKNQTGQHLRFIHPGGLKLALDFPLYCQTRHGVGFHWLVAEQAEVQAGQAIAHYDRALLSQPGQSLGVFLRVLPHPKIHSIHCRTGYHQALEDDLLAIQLLSTEDL